MTLSLDARQRAMLAAMGVRVWQPNAAAEAVVQHEPILRAETPAPPVGASASIRNPARSGLLDSHKRG